MMAIGDKAKKDLALMQTVFPLSKSKVERKINRKIE
jgi:hypothetical protein